jgi:hypothetical protein
MSGANPPVGPAVEALRLAMGGGCVPYELVSCFDSGIEHGCCESLLLDGFTVSEVTAAERELER